jgi:hypothetical protein
MGNFSQLLRQFYDTLKMFDLAGDPSKEKFVFLGDYVDRGMFSL